MRGDPHRRTQRSLRFNLELRTPNREPQTPNPSISKAVLMHLIGVCYPLIPLKSYVPTTLLKPTDLPLSKRNRTLRWRPKVAEHSEAERCYKRRLPHKRKSRFRKYMSRR